MARYTRRTMPDPTPPIRLPRGTPGRPARCRPPHLVAIAAAALVASLPVAAAGAVTIVVLQSDGLAQLPVGVATIPPLACDPGGTP